MPTGDKPRPAEASRDTWVWSPTLSVYYHANSDTYALPGADGAWTYLTPAELAARSGGASSSTSGINNGPVGEDGRGPTTATRGSEEKEDGELEDDVGWGGLMEPEQLERVMNAKDKDKKAQQQAYHGGDDRHLAYGGKRDDTTRQSEADRYGDRDRDKHPAYAAGDSVSRAWTAPASATSTPTPYDDESCPPPDASAHLVRLVVKRSKDLEPGGVAVFDARQGGIQIGRDRCERGAPARLRVREMEVSKTHALVYWGHGGDEDGEDEGWFIVDLGSTLGTYVAHRGQPDATRLSEAKCASKPYPLSHLSRVTVGTTTVVVHVHADWPCGECQLSGNVQISLDDGTAAGKPTTTEPESEPVQAGRLGLDAGRTRGDRQFKRKLEMAALRDTLLGEDTGRPSARGPNAYMDRSAQRRKLHPASPPRQRDNGYGARAADRHNTSTSASSSPAPPAGPSSVSRALLAKQGWTPGQGLGRDGGGRAEAIVPVVRSERAGLGARGQVADVPANSEGEGDWRSRGRQRRWDEVGRS